MIGQTGTVRSAGSDDADAVGSLLAEAGLDEAVVSWVVPDERVRRDLLVAGTELTAAWVRAVLDSGTVLIAADDDGRLAGVSVWELVDAPAPATAAPPDDVASFFERLYGEYAPRMALVHELTSRRHPHDDPHWYLQQMVVTPAARGRGLGAAMLRHQLDRIDAGGLGAYLEASTPRNQRLYERHGFQTMGEPIMLPERGPSLRPMWRPPAPSRG
jgi:ribosomal protein S18 acetylase RimI-like enzyme